MSEFSRVGISSNGLSFVVISAPSCYRFRVVWPLGIYPIRASLTMGACRSVLQAGCTCTSHQYFVSHHYLVLFHTLLQSYGLYTCTVLLLFAYIFGSLTCLFCVWRSLSCASISSWYLLSGLRVFFKGGSLTLLRFSPSAFASLQWDNSTKLMSSTCTCNPNHSKGFASSGLLIEQAMLLYNWHFSCYSTPIHWLVHGHI